MFTRVPGAQVAGIVLAGAYPRGQSLFDRLRPRPLLPIAQTPLIVYPLRWLAESAIPHATICCNSAARAVRGALAGSPALPIAVEFHEDWMPRGAAGCVRDAALKTRAQTFVVTDGTTIPRVDLQGLLETHAVCDAALTVVVHHDPSQPPGASAFTPGGIYVFDRRVFDYVPEKGFQDIKERLIPRLHAAGERVVTHTGIGDCPRVFNSETYLAVNHWMVSRVVAAQRPPAEYAFLDDALVHTSLRLGRGARLVGPMVVGPGVTIGEDATLVGPGTIGANCSVGESALVSRSVLWNGCWVGRGTSIDRCVVGDGAVIRPGVSLYSALKGGHVSLGPAARRHRNEETARPGWKDAPLPLPATAWRGGV